MYLARRFVRNHILYTIRESYPDGEVLRHRDLLELGRNPQQYIHYADNRAFFVDEKVVDGLKKKGINADPFELEKLFYPFVDAAVRARIDMFADREKHRRWKPASRKLRQRILDETHPFDRRRAHFLRFGQTDQRKLLRSVPLFRVLLDKSRDEIEQYFLHQEMALRPDEYKLYMYTIFNLQAFFTESFAHSMPEALNLEKMDLHFLDRVCALDRDEEFWKGLERGDTLHEYLVRYVIMYFDYSFASGSGWEQYIRDFMNSHRRYTPPKSARRMSMSDAATVFGVSRAELAAMDMKELKRVFRKKARELHPDKGGDHEAFIELATAYQEISRTKVAKR
ncbi:MAG TPA: J domain-containing protein [Desulfobacteraceae bacterium]|nr:J domain-containing protein [Desulfobacteraceae bacterium]